MWAVEKPLFCAVANPLISRTLETAFNTRPFCAVRLSHLTCHHGGNGLMEGICGLMLFAISVGQWEMAEGSTFQQLVSAELRTCAISQGLSIFFLCCNKGEDSKFLKAAVSWSVSKEESKIKK
uniref:Uncharacterized protein n=1 Tax=Sphaerodactylus townsendi TaxID=933632 RepID=A0ACB8GB27_9SAUR